MHKGQQIKIGEHKGRILSFGEEGLWAGLTGVRLKKDNIGKHFTLEDIPFTIKAVARNGKSFYAVFDKERYLKLNKVSRDLEARRNERKPERVEFTAGRKIEDFDPIKSLSLWGRIKLFFHKLFH